MVRRVSPLCGIIKYKIKYISVQVHKESTSHTSVKVYKARLKDEEEKEGVLAGVK
jgi:hypothetical protein